MKWKGLLFFVGGLLLSLAIHQCLFFCTAACMTWELAESGNDCITSVINGADLVPTFSAASVDDLRAEVLF